MLVICLFLRSVQKLLSKKQFIPHFPLLLCVAQCKLKGGNADARQDAKTDENFLISHIVQKIKVIRFSSGQSKMFKKPGRLRAVRSAL